MAILLFLPNLAYASIETQSIGTAHVIGTEEALSLTYVAIGMAVIAFSVAVAALATKKGEKVEWE